MDQFITPERLLLLDHTTLLQGLLLTFCGVGVGSVCLSKKIGLSSRTKYIEVNLREFNDKLLYRNGRGVYVRFGEKS